MAATETRVSLNYEEVVEYMRGVVEKEPDKDVDKCVYFRGDALSEEYDGPECIIGKFFWDHGIRSMPDPLNSMDLDYVSREKWWEQHEILRHMSVRALRFLKTIQRHQDRTDITWKEAFDQALKEMQNTEYQYDWEA